MMGPRFGKAGDAARPEHAAELQHRLGGVGHVMKRVKAQDAIDACVWKSDSATVEDEKLRRRLISNWWQPRVKLLAEVQRARRNVERGGRAAKLRQTARRPACSRAEVEHVQAWSKSEPGHQLRKGTEEIGRVLRVGKRLGQIPVRKLERRAVVVVGGACELFDCKRGVQLAGVDEGVVGREGIAQADLKFIGCGDLGGNFA